jgi:hypothetical protein
MQRLAGISWRHLPSSNVACHSRNRLRARRVFVAINKEGEYGCVQTRTQRLPRMTVRSSTGLWVYEGGIFSR